MGKGASSEQVVREIHRRTELCRRDGLAPNLYYRWSKEFLEAGKYAAFGRVRARVRGAPRGPQRGLSRAVVEVADGEVCLGEGHPDPPRGVVCRGLRCPSSSVHWRNETPEVADVLPHTGHRPVAVAGMDVRRHVVLGPE